MATEPTSKRAVAFVDGQNLFYAAKSAFGYTYPNYDVSLLTQAVCSQKGWTAAQVRFYRETYDACLDPQDCRPKVSL